MKHDAEAQLIHAADSNIVTSTHQHAGSRYRRAVSYNLQAVKRPSLRYIQTAFKWASHNTVGSQTHYQSSVQEIARLWGNQPRANHPNIRTLTHINKTTQPIALQNLRIVVEEAEVFSVGIRGRKVCNRSPLELTLAMKDPNRNWTFCFDVRQP